MDISSRDAAGVALRSFTYSYTDAGNSPRDLRQTMDRQRRGYNDHMQAVIVLYAAVLVAAVCMLRAVRLAIVDDDGHGWRDATAWLLIMFGLGALAFGLKVVA